MLHRYALASRHLPDACKRGTRKFELLERFESYELEYLR